MTDDFTGMMGHSVNLSAKSVVAIACYAKLAAMQGKKDVATKYRAIAEDYAASWQAMADDGDHYRLAFDQPGTWSQKYNLAWDTVFGLELFPKEVMRKELAFYAKQRLAYGTPARQPQPGGEAGMGDLGRDDGRFEEDVRGIRRPDLPLCRTRRRTASRSPTSTSRTPVGAGPTRRGPWSAGSS